MSLPRLALTTTLDRGKQLADLVLAGGGEPVLLPCIEVAPAPDGVLDHARAQADDADWLLITSPRVVAVLWPNGDMPDIAVAAVGPQTAIAVERAGGSVEVVGDEGADALVSRLESCVSASHVFFPHGAATNLATVGALRERGASVAATTVYETRPIPPGLDRVDAALFGSPSAVIGWALSRSFDELALAAIGPTTAQALANRGYPPQIVPPRPDYQLSINQVVQYLTDRSPV